MIIDHVYYVDDDSTGAGFALAFLLGLIGLIIGVAIGKKDTKTGAIIGFVVQAVIGIIISIIVFRMLQCVSSPVSPNGSAAISYSGGNSS